MVAADIAILGLAGTFVMVVIALLTYAAARKGAAKGEGEEVGRNDQKISDHEDRIRFQEKRLGELNENYMDIRQRLTLVEQSIQHMMKSVDQTVNHVEAIRTRTHEITNALTSIQAKLDIAIHYPTLARERDLDKREREEKIK